MRCYFFARGGTTMRATYIFSCFLSLSTLTSVAIAQEAEQPEVAIAQEAEQPDKSRIIEEIVVTSTYRETNLMDTAVSVSAVDADLIGQIGASEMSELFRSLPGLNMVASDAGSNRFVVRGVSSQTGDASYQQTFATVAVYLDDTPMTSATGPSRQLSGSLFDIARVEVLKGPQGTLFGEGSQSGTIRYIYNEPNTEEFETSVKGVLNGQAQTDDLSFRLDGMVNIPMTDNFAVRISAFQEDEAGWIDKTNLASVSEDENTLVSTGGRVSAKWWINDKVSAKGTVFYVDTENKGTRISTSAYEENVNVRLPGLTANAQDEVILYNLRFDIDLGFAALTSTTSYFDRKAHSYSEFSAEIAALFDTFVGFNVNLGPFLAGERDPANFPIPCNVNPDPNAALGFFNGFCPNGNGMTLFGFSNDSTAESQRFVQEFRLISSGDGPWLWTAGLFYKDSSDSIDAFQPFGVTPGLEATIPFFTPLFTDPSNDHVDTLEEIAAFGEATYIFNEHWEVTLGARVSNLKQDFENTSQTTDDTPFSPKAVVSWRPVDGSLYYFSYATGFRPGNNNNGQEFNARQFAQGGLPQAAIDQALSRVTYDGDEMINYEMGAKWSLWDGRLRLTSSIYHLDWQDAILLFRDLTIPSANNTFNQNAGTAHSTGIELQMDLAPTDNLRIRLGADYNEAEIDSGPLKGNTLLHAPETSLSLGFDYTMPLPRGLQGRFMLNYQYVDDQFGDSANTNVIDDYNLVGVRYTLESLSDERWSVALFANNLLNDEVILNIAPQSGFSYFLYERPRVVGLEFNWRGGK